MHDTDGKDAIACDPAAQRLLLASRSHGAHVPCAVTATLEIVERDPLATGGRFRGALLRALMEVPGGFWARQPHLYDRYVAVLRASALARRGLPFRDRMEFWTPLDSPHTEATPMGTTQDHAAPSLTKQQLASIRAELLRESAHHEGTLRYDVITAAIERIDAGAYGNCLDCGAAIPYDRLAVMPETDRCVGCSPVH